MKEKGEHYYYFSSGENHSDGGPHYGDPGRPGPAARNKEEVMPLLLEDDGEAGCKYMKH